MQSARICQGNRGKPNRERKCPQYIGTHQDKAPIVRTDYCELETLGLISYRSLHTVIKVGKQVLPIVERIMPGVNAKG